MKKSERQYERKIKVNHHNDVFTTFQKQTQTTYSPYPQTRPHKDQPSHHSQHQHIQMLKSTLKSLTPQPSMEITKTFDQIAFSAFGSAQSIQNQKYNFKLDQLSKNLEQIASKCHFATLQNKSAKNNTHSSSRNRKANHESKQLDNRQKSYTLSPYEQPYKTELYYRNLNSISSNFPISKSHSFVKKQESRSHSKNSSQNRSSHQIQKSSKDKKKNSEILIWEGKSEFKSNNSKSFSKKDMLTDSMAKQHSKNLTKIFDSYDDSTQFTKRKRALTQLVSNRIILQKQLHRSKITSILTTDSIYTASLDYSIAKTSQIDSQWRSSVLQTFRGGVEHIGVVGDRVFASGRDCYIRSVDGNFFHKFSSVPIKFFESERHNQLHIAFISNQVKLFDIQKNIILSKFSLDRKCQIMCKQNRSLYLGMGAILRAVDWNAKQLLISVFQDKKAEDVNWLSDYHSKAFATQNQGKISFLGNNFQKQGTDQLPEHSYFKLYDWNSNGLNILAVSQQTKSAKLLRYYNNQPQQQVDFESEGQTISTIKTTPNQIIYGRKSGKITIKTYRV